MMTTRLCVSLLPMVLGSLTSVLAQDREARAQPTVQDGPRDPRIAPSANLVGWCNMPWQFCGPWLNEGTRYDLVRCPDVQKALKLSWDQQREVDGETLTRTKKEITSMTIKVYMKWTDVKFTGLREAGLIRLADLKQTLDRDLLKILDTDQRRRLDEIALQQAGPRVIARPEIAKELGLGLDQVERINNLMAESRARVKVLVEAINEGTGPLKLPDGPIDAGQLVKAMGKAQLDRNRAVAIVNQESEAADARAILRILKPDQKQRLDQMLGEPFNLSVLTTANTWGYLTDGTFRQGRP